MNKCELIGRLTKEPEIKMTQSGDKIARFTVACYRTKEVTDFIPCTAFKVNAERAEQYLHKGNQVGIEGSINTGSYEKNGVRHYTMEVFVNNIDLIGGKPEQKEDGFTNLIKDEDLPF